MCPRHGITRRSGALLIAAVQFVHGFFIFISAAITVNLTSHIAFFSVSVASAMNMWLALVLCVGVNMNRPNLLLLWIGWAAVILILFVVCVPFIALYSYALTEHFKGANFATTYIIFAFSFFLHCLFLHVVYGYYEELVLAQMQQDRDIFRNEQDHQDDHQDINHHQQDPQPVHIILLPEKTNQHQIAISSFQLINEKMMMATLPDSEQRSKSNTCF